MEKIDDLVMAQWFYLLAFHPPVPGSKPKSTILALHFDNLIDTAFVLKGWK